jgi:two-component system sensor histidine kinase DegS
VPLPPPQTMEFSQHLLTLEQQIRQELEQSQQQAQEIRLLLGQTTNEVEKLSQREITLANRVRDMEVNLDSYSRADIRTLYNANHEVQLRLFMMRGQAEQLESRQQNLRDYQDKLRTILDLVQVQQDLNTARQSQEGEPKAQSLGMMVSTWQSAIAVIEGQEEERLRLAREIQDGPTQSLTNLLLHLEVCRHVLKRDVEGAQKELDQLKTMLAGTLQETRRLLADIRPLALEELGIVEMLRRYLHEIGREHGVEAAINGGGLNGALPHHLQTALYRLIQGAIGAMVIPGRGGHLSVTLRSDNDRVFALIETRRRDARYPPPVCMRQQPRARPGDFVYRKRQRCDGRCRRTGIARVLRLGPRATRTARQVRLAQYRRPTNRTSVPWFAPGKDSTSKDF